MPTSSVGNRGQRGVTLIEMMAVVAIIGMITAISAPMLTAGLDSVRMASATNSVSSFLNAAVNRAERRQTGIELVISPKDRRLTMFSNEPGFTRKLDLPQGIAIDGVVPAEAAEGDGTCRIILMPGGTVPGIGIRLSNSHGARRIVRVDPMTGFPRVESVKAE